MKKKLLEKPEMTIILFDDTDIVTASSGETEENQNQETTEE